MEKASMLDYDEDIYWLCLSRKYSYLNFESVLGVYETYGSLRHLWQAEPTQLAGFGVKREIIGEVLNIRSSKTLEECKKLKDRLDKGGIRLIKFFDADFPVQLKMLRGQKEGTPILLLHHGVLTKFQRCVAIVGTRVLSQYGHMMARKLAKQLATEGCTIVSGLARGTDTEAHCGALEAARGRTIAVAAWLEPIYPEENIELASDITKHGCVVSEFYAAGPGGAIPSSFVRRNRITSGLSDCVIAIESDEKGGTAHQVEFALSQKRKVFVLKPRAGDARAQRGYLYFVKKGAVPFKKAETILEYLRGKEPSVMDHFVRRQGDLRVHLQ
jgi:DNA processing protein